MFIISTLVICPLWTYTYLSRVQQCLSVPLSELGLPRTPSLTGECVPIVHIGNGGKQHISTLIDAANDR